MLGIYKDTDKFTNFSICPQVDSIIFSYTPAGRSNTKIVEIGLFGEIRRVAEVQREVQILRFPCGLLGKARTVGEWA